MPPFSYSRHTVCWGLHEWVWTQVRPKQKTNINKPGFRRAYVIGFWLLLCDADVP